MSKPLWKKPTSWLVLALIVVFTFFVSQESRAETGIEVAPIVAYGGTPNTDQWAILLTEGILDKYELGVMLLSDNVDRDEGNRGIQALRVAKYKTMEVGIGFAYWSNQSTAWNANETFALMLGKTFRERLTIRIRHWSTGGTSSRNSGLDILTLSYTFK